MSNEAEIRPFPQVNFPEAELAELRRRVNATRWPDRETVTDDSQGVRLALIQDLARYWGTGHDWRKCEENLNALPNFLTEIDGLDIHFIHVRSQHEAALPAGAIELQGGQRYDGILARARRAALRLGPAAR